LRGLSLGLQFLLVLSESETKQTAKNDQDRNSAFEHKKKEICLSISAERPGFLRKLSHFVPAWDKLGQTFC